MILYNLILYTTYYGFDDDFFEKGTLGTFSSRDKAGKARSDFIKEKVDEDGRLDMSFVDEWELAIETIELDKPLW